MHNNNNISCIKKISCDSILASLSLDNLAIFPSQYSTSISSSLPFPIDSSSSILFWANVDFQVIGQSQHRVWQFQGSGYSDSMHVTILYTVSDHYNIFFEGRLTGTLTSSSQPETLNASSFITTTNTTSKNETIFTIIIDTTIINKPLKEFSYNIFKNDSGNPPSSNCPSQAITTNITGETFNDCSGIIYIYSPTVSDCSFNSCSNIQINNNTNNNPLTTSLQNCSFIQCPNIGIIGVTDISDISGIYITNCTFISCGDYPNYAIAFTDQCALNSCQFETCSYIIFSGSVGEFESNVISDCSFNNCSNIKFDNFSLTVQNCPFYNCILNSFFTPFSFCSFENCSNIQGIFTGCSFLDCSNIYQLDTSGCSFKNVNSIYIGNSSNGNLYNDVSSITVTYPPQISDCSFNNCGSITFLSQQLPSPEPSSTVSSSYFSGDSNTNTIISIYCSSASFQACEFTYIQFDICGSNIIADSTCTFTNCCGTNSDPSSNTGWNFSSCGN